MYLDHSHLQLPFSIFPEHLPTCSSSIFLPFSLTHLFFFVAVAHWVLFDFVFDTGFHISQAYLKLLCIHWATDSPASTFWVLSFQACVSIPSFIQCCRTNSRFGSSQASTLSLELQSQPYCSNYFLYYFMIFLHLFHYCFRISFIHHSHPTLSPL